jgi:hypothetical protein
MPVSLHPPSLFGAIIGAIMRDVGGGAEKEAASAAVAFKPTTQQNTNK